MTDANICQIIDLFPGLKGTRAGVGAGTLNAAHFLLYLDKRNLSHGESFAADFIASLFDPDADFSVACAFQRWDSTYRKAWVLACAMYESYTG